jgi:hypothetical protein
MRLKKKKLEKINKWLYKHNYTVHWGKEDCVVPNDRKIYITPGKCELYSLLHECGHVQIFSKVNYNKRFGVIEKSEKNGNFRKTNVYKYQKMMEEIEAWERGWKISKKLKIKINKKEYFNEAAKWVGTYRRFL